MGIHGTIRDDIDPFLLTVYLMTTLMSAFSLTRPWLNVLDHEGVSHETFVKEFARFISPSISTGVEPDTGSDSEGEQPAGSLFFSMDPVPVEPPEKK